MITKLLSIIPEKKKKYELEIDEKMYITTDIPVSMPNFDPLEKLLKLSPKSKEKVKSQVKSLINSYGSLSTKDENKSTLMPLPTTSGPFTNIFGDSSQCTRARNKFVKIGLIELVDPSYRFNSKENKAQIFRWNHKVASYLEEKLKDTEPWVMPKTKKIECIEYYGNYNLLPGKHRIPLKGTHYSTDSAIKTLLEENYPIFKKLKEIVKELNTKYYKGKPELIVKAEPTIHKAKKTISKIGIRATSPFCNSLKTPKDAFNGLIRKDIQEKYKILESIDVNGSVPRVTFSLRRKKWLSKAELNDMYDSILKECENQIQERLQNVTEAIENKVPNYKILLPRKPILEEFVKSIRNDEREAIKKLTMRGYFCNSVKEMVSKITQDSSYTEKMSKLEVEIACDIFYDSLRNIFGESFQSEIFVYESLIMNLSALKLCQRGNFCSLIYDGFFLEKKLSDEELDALLEESFNEILPLCQPSLDTATSEEVLRTFPRAVSASVSRDTSYPCETSASEFCPVCGCFNSIQNGSCIECKSEIPVSENFANFKNITESKNFENCEVSIYNNPIPIYPYNNIYLSLYCKMDNFRKNITESKNFLSESCLKYHKLE